MENTFMIEFAYMDGQTLQFEKITNLNSLFECQLQFIEFLKDFGYERITDQCRVFENGQHIGLINKAGDLELIKSHSEIQVYPTDQQIVEYLNKENSLYYEEFARFSKNAEENGFELFEELVQIISENEQIQTLSAQPETVR